jgi:hypothetical protein
MPGKNFVGEGGGDKELTSDSYVNEILQKEHHCRRSAFCLFRRRESVGTNAQGCHAQLSDLDSGHRTHEPDSC